MGKEAQKSLYINARKDSFPIHLGNIRENIHALIIDTIVGGITSLTPYVHLFGWSVGRSVCRLVGWLVGWLAVGCNFHLISTLFSTCYYMYVKLKQWVQCCKRPKVNLPRLFPYCSIIFFQDTIMCFFSRIEFLLYSVGQYYW